MMSPYRMHLPLLALLGIAFFSPVDAFSSTSTFRRFGKPSTCLFDLSNQGVDTQSRVLDCATRRPALAQRSKSQSKRSVATQVLTRTAVGFCTIALMQSSFLSVPAAHAKAAAVATEHLHTGQKVANFFRSFGIPDLAVLAIISALPVVELRGAVPVGVWMGLPITTVFPVCVLGNMIPILPILLLLRNERLKKLMGPILKRAEKKTAELGMGSKEKQWVSLAAFVGIPLPGTGAWTGAMGAFLLGMPIVTALTSIFAGVFAAGVIMSAISLAGRKGGIAALVALFVLTGIELLKKEK